MANDTAVAHPLWYALMLGLTLSPPLAASGMSDPALDLSAPLELLAQADMDTDSRPLTASAPDLSAPLESLVQTAPGTGTGEPDPAAEDAHDQGLLLALRTMLRENPAVRGKRQEVTAQGFAVEGAKARWLPRLGVSAATMDDDGLEAQVSLRLEQPLWTFGKLTEGLAEARAQLNAEERDLLRVQRELMGEVIDAYTRIQGLDAESAVVADNVAEHERLLEHIQRRLRGQLATEADVQLGRSRLIQAQSQQLRLGNDLQAARATLQALTIQPVETAALIPAALLELPPLSELQAQVLAADAGLGHKAAVAEAARANARVVQAAILPDVLLRAETNFLEDPLRDTAGDDRDARIGLVVQSSLEGLGLVGYRQGRGAEARAAAAADEVALTQVQLERDLATQVAQHAMLGALIEAQHGAVDSVAATAASYLRLYDSGRKSWIDLLNIQRELTEQRVRLAQLDAERAQVALRLALQAGRLDAIAGLPAPE